MPPVWDGHDRRRTGGGLLDLRKEMRDGNDRLEEKIESTAARLEEKLEGHAKARGELSDRVLMIETERRLEEKQAVRKGAWAGIVGAAVVTFLFRLLESILGRHQ